MQQQIEAAKTLERRQFFRVDDEVNLIYKKIDETQVLEQSLNNENILGNYSLAAALDSISHEAASVLRRLEHNCTDIIDYVKFLDKKIDLLAQAVMLQNSQFDRQNIRTANISASGIAFDCEEHLEKGAFLDIKVLLVNSMAVIAACGKVVYCRQNTDRDSCFPYVVGVDYVNIRDQDHELLIKHVVRRQLQQIRDKKEKE